MTTRLERLVAGREDPGFRIHRNQPVLLLAQRWSGRWDVTFLVVLATLVASRVVVTVPAGTFGPAGDIVADVGAMLFGRPGSTTSAAVPWLRDYADIAIMLLVSAHTAQMVGQWQRLAALPGKLRDAGLLAASLRSKAVFNGILDRHQRRFNSPLLEIAAALAAVAVVSQLLPLPAEGIYRGLGANPTAVDRFTGWWANPTAHPAAFVVLMASFWLYLYLTFRHGLMGVLMLGLLADARRAASRNGQPWFGYSVPHSSVTGAIDAVREALYDVLLSMTLLVTAFAIANLYVRIPDGLVVAVVLPYVLLNPLFLVVPLVHLNGRLRASRAHLVYKAETELRIANEKVRQLVRPRSASRAARVQADPTVLGLRLTAASGTLENVKALQTNVIDVAGLARALVLYLVPVVALVWTFLGGGG